MLIKSFNFILLFVVSISFIKSIHLFSYEAHSFNDLDYMIQQLKRGSFVVIIFFQGVDTLKIDISMGDYTSCSMFSTWKSADNLCEPIGFDTEV